MEEESGLPWHVKFHNLPWAHGYPPLLLGTCGWYPETSASVPAFPAHSNELAFSFVIALLIRDLKASCATMWSTSTYQNRILLKRKFYIGSGTTGSLYFSIKIWFLTSFSVWYHWVLPHHSEAPVLHPQRLPNRWWWAGTFPPPPQTSWKGQWRQLVMLFHSDSIVMSLHNCESSSESEYSSFFISLDPQATKNEYQTHPRAITHMKHWASSDKLMWTPEHYHVCDSLTVLLKLVHHLLLPLLSLSPVARSTITHISSVSLPHILMQNTQGA
jgi:hypothetical protein